MILTRARCIIGDYMAMRKVWDELDKVKGMVGEFQVHSMDEKKFKRFFDSILNPPRHGNPDSLIVRKNVDITGYFSEGAVESLCRLKSKSNIRLITPELNTKRRQDVRNLRALRKMQNEGIEIKIHKRLHARFMIIYNISEKGNYGQLLVGSFDFNKEGITAERRDFGLLTAHPDIVNSAIDYFNKLWNEDFEITTLDEEYPP